MPASPAASSDAASKPSPFAYGEGPPLTAGARAHAYFYGEAPLPEDSDDDDSGGGGLLVLPGDAPLEFVLPGAYVTAASPRMRAAFRALVRDPALLLQAKRLRSAL